VFAGEYEGRIHPDVNEVGDYVYKDMHEIEKQIEEDPQKFTSWFKIAFPRIKKWWREGYEVGNPK
jgi:isopentenyl-diphosphate delta-isomerase